MGFRPGTQVTVDNALKMMLVKSANDMAVVLAEGVGGSIDGFSALMNQNAQARHDADELRQSERPAADGQITSARDLAILARAIIRDLPEYEDSSHFPRSDCGQLGHAELQQADRVLSGADGFKTGFIPRPGYNPVASATRNGKRLIAVVLGAHRRDARRAAQMLERGFASNTLAWLRPRSARSTIWCRSTPRRRTCATSGAAASATSPPATQDEDTVASSGGSTGGRRQHDLLCSPGCSRRS